MKNTLYLCPLESYKSRYTEMLDRWERKAFHKAGFTTRTMKGFTKTDTVPMNIITGEVLDSCQRPLWALEQIRSLLKARQGQPQPARVYFSDFFHPGLEALPYSRLSFTPSAFLWAQSFDRYDFTTRMINWMRPWEIMAFDIYEHVFVANRILKDLIVAALPSAEPKVHVVGLPFNSRLVGKMADLSFNQGVEYDGVYSSRWDREKNFDLFLDLVEACPSQLFAICTAHDPRSDSSGNTVRYMARIDRLDNLTLHANLEKPEYYAVLASTKVQINTALQDWTSFTLLEALTFDCLPLYPNFRSFPDALNYEERFLYPPFNLPLLVAKFKALIDSDATSPQEVLQYNDGTLKRIADVLLST